MVALMMIHPIRTSLGEFKVDEVATSKSRLHFPLKQLNLFGLNTPASF
jgi:hypothetical protein